MLPKKNKVSRSIFNEVFKKGVFKNAPFFNIKVINYKETPNNIGLFSIVIPKKVVKKATKRNLIKRRFYNTIYQNKDLLQNTKDKIYLFFLKEDVSDVSFEDFSEKILTFLKEN